MKWAWIIGIVLVLAMLGYCRDVIFPYSWHQKMTIEVEADGQVYSGSSVVRVSWRKNDPLGAANGATWLSSLRGEAPFVEIPGRGVLFALLRTANNSSHAENLATGILTNRLGSPRGNEDLMAVKEAEGETFILTEAYYPLLVTFTDISDPKTIKVVDPGNLSSTFGLEFSLKQITVEITNEPVTEGKIAQVLGWWLALGTERKDPPPFRVPDNSPRGHDTVGITQFIMGRH